MNLFQCRAVSEVQLIGSWSHTLYNIKWPYVLILKLFRKSQMEVLSAQQHLLPNLIQNLSAVPISILLVDLLGLHQMFVNQLLAVLYKLNLFGTINLNSL